MREAPQLTIDRELSEQPDTVHKLHNFSLKCEFIVLIFTSQVSLKATAGLRVIVSELGVLLKCKHIEQLTSTLYSEIETMDINFSISLIKCDSACKFSRTVVALPQIDHDYLSCLIRLMLAERATHLGIECSFGRAKYMERLCFGAKSTAT
jgi:hypothetical protein